MSCPGCLTSERERQAQMNSKYAEAKAFAIANGTYVVLYKEPITGEIEYMKAEIAQQLNINGQLVSPI